jgi:hypothetical protein
MPNYQWFFLAILVITAWSKKSMVVISILLRHPCLWYFNLWEIFQYSFDLWDICSILLQRLCWNIERNIPFLHCKSMGPYFFCTAVETKHKFYFNIALYFYLEVSRNTFYSSFVEVQRKILKNYELSFNWQYSAVKGLYFTMSTQCLSPCPNWIRSECVPPRNQGGTTLSCGWGGLGGPNLDN